MIYPKYSKHFARRWLLAGSSSTGLVGPSSVWSSSASPVGRDSMPIRESLILALKRWTWCKFFLSWKLYPLSVLCCNFGLVFFFPLISPACVCERTNMPLQIHTSAFVACASLFIAAVVNFLYKFYCARSPMYRLRKQGLVRFPDCVLARCLSWLLMIA